MKITMKPLKGSTFEVEAEPEQKVEDLKKIVATAASEFPADQQKLIYAGRILKDDELVKDIGIKEGAGHFIVVMVAKAKPPAAAAPAAQPAAAAAPAAATPAPAAAPAAATPEAAPDPAAQAASGLVTGAAAEATVTQLCEMGFPRPEVERCLAAAFGNPDRAVEYLMNGIPEGVLPAAGAPPPAAAGGAPAPAPGAAPPAAAGRGAAFPAMGGGAGAGGGGAAANLPPVLANLRNSPQFAQYAQMVARNPAALDQMLTVIAQTNPEVVQAIQENQEAFMQMVQEAAAGGGQRGAAPQDPVAAMLAGQAGGGGGAAGEAAQLQQMAGMLAQNPAMLQQLLPQIEQANPELAAAIRENPQALVQMLAEAGAAGGAGGMPGGGGGGPGPTVIQLTEEESAAVGRLVALGFDRQTAAQAYLACDKNEEVAANFLFENGDADMD